MAIDGKWGTGKSIFINLWGQYLRSNGYPVVTFNAWESDFSKDPFHTLSSQLKKELHQFKDNSLHQKIRTVMQAAKRIQVIRHASGIIRIGIPLIQGPILQEIVNFFVSCAEKIFPSCKDNQETINDFKSALQDMTKTASSLNSELPLIILIDELDRCRPSYAVELLEIIKHLFSVNNVIFILAINRAELTHSVKALYGSDFDATGYLRRFFNFIYQLPKPDLSGIDRFTDDTLNYAGINGCFDQTENQPYAKENKESAYKLLRVVFGTLNFSLREIAQEVHRLGLVIATLPNNQLLFLRSAVAAIILKMCNEELYYQFIGGEINDKDLVERLCEDEMFKKLKQTNEGCLFEAILIMAYKEIISTSDDVPEALKNKTPLENAYLADQYVGKASHMKEFGKKVLSRVEEFRVDKNKNHDYRLGFIHSVNRLEFLDKNLIGNEKTF